MTTSIDNDIIILSTPEMTTEERFKAAVKFVKDTKAVRIRQNVMSCCRSCTTDEQLGKDKSDLPLAWTFGGQGGAVSFYGGEAFNRVDLTPLRKDRFTGRLIKDGKFSVRVTERHIKRARATKVYWNFDDIEAAKAVDFAFRSFGFEVEWNGTDTQCVVVEFPEMVLSEKA